MKWCSAAFALVCCGLFPAHIRKAWLARRLGSSWRQVLVMKRTGQLCLRVAGDCHRSLLRSAAPALGQQTGRALAVEVHTWQASESQPAPTTFAALAVSQSSWHSSSSGFSSTAASLQHVEPSDLDSTVTPADPKASPPDAEDPLPAVGEQPAESPAAAATPPDSEEDDWLEGRPAAEVVPETPTFSGFPGSQPAGSSSEGGFDREPGARRIIPEDDDIFATLDTKTDARFIVPFEAGFSLQGSNNDILSKVKAASGTDVQVRGGVNARRMIIKVAGTISAIRDAIELLMQHWGQNPSGRELSTSTGDRLRLRMLVPKVLSGKVIGFRGANIKAIEAETGCYVRLEPRSNLSKMYNSREVQMAGPPAALGAAVVRVLQTVACERSYQREMAHNDQPKLVIPIPDEAVGRIIGTSGANLRSLSQRFGVSLAVSSKDNFIPGTRFRKLLVSGTTESQRAVEAEVIEAMREVALDDGIELENTGSYTEDPADEDMPSFMDNSLRRPARM